MNNVPMHPGNQMQANMAPQEAPQAQQAPNPYFTPSPALQGYNGQLSGENEAKLAQAHQAGAQAGKAEAEARIMASLGASQSLRSQPQVDGRMVEQLAQGIADGSIGDAELNELVQSGNVPPEAVQAAVELVKGAQQPAQGRGLGSF